MLRMETKEIISKLIERGDDLSLAAAEEIRRLSAKYEGLDEAYDLMSKDFLFLQSEVLKLRKTKTANEAEDN